MTDLSDTFTPEVTEPGARNGTEGRKTRVRFGSQPHQTVPHEWAERMLTRLFQSNRAAFGRVLKHAAGVDDDE